MSLLVSTFFQLVLVLTFSKFCYPTTNPNKISDRNLVEASCPLNFNALRKLVHEVYLGTTHLYMPSRCEYIPEGIRLVRSEYLRTNGYFVPPSATFQACWESYKKIVSEFLHGFDIETTCLYHPEWISENCLTITSREQFESRFPESKLQEMRLYCNQSLDNGFACESCTSKLLSLGKMYLHENVSVCSRYMFMYAAAFINELGPTDIGIATCFFGLEKSIRSTNVKKQHKLAISGVYLGCIIGIVGTSIAVVVGLIWKLHNKYEGERNDSVKDETSLDLGLPFYHRSTNLVKFKVEEIRKATMNFSTDNLIGKGGYGNVYKGILTDGSEVAFKRFKNCSASGDASFAHEVEIIASVRHVNLVALRGYCTAMVHMEGHQRIIVCDLMHNGSLYDHLFGSGRRKLSWPIRQKIALGTARGLAYLHNGVHPAIIHRDIKASNILLDETFEPKVADFGLAKFYSQGMTHLSTRVAGTLGYVAPEYALYGTLTERSDVYSFGVVLLEILSGRKAYENNEGKVSLLTDWAWSLVKEGRALDVVEGSMPKLGLPEVMEQYVHIAIICAHPLLHARPTMDQIVNILETSIPVVSTLGTYLGASTGKNISFSSNYVSCLSAISDKPNSENRDTQECFTLTIV